MMNPQIVTAEGSQRDNQASENVNVTQSKKMSVPTGTADANFTRFASQSNVDSMSVKRGSIGERRLAGGQSA